MTEKMSVEQALGVYANTVERLQSVADECSPHFREPMLAQVRENEQALATLRAELAGMKADAEIRWDAADDLVNRLKGWDKAYPTDIFSEPTEAERDWLHETKPGLMDRIAASMGRHMAACIRDDLAAFRAALDRAREVSPECTCLSEMADGIGPLHLPDCPLATHPEQTP